MIKQKEVLSHLKKLAEENDDFRMSVEDFFLLLTIYDLNENPDDEELDKLSRWYYKGQVIAARNTPDQQLLDWGKRLKILANQGFVELLPNVIKSTAAVKGYDEMDIKKMEVTDKFIDTLRIKGKDMYWEYLVEEAYGREIIIGDNTIFTYLPDSSARKAGLLTEEDLKNYFWKKIDNGNPASFREMISVIQWLTSKNAINYTIFRFLNEYPGHLATYKKQNKVKA